MTVGFGTPSNYIITIYLPQNYVDSYNNEYAPFGNLNSNDFVAETTYCTCQSTFTVGITARGQQMLFQNLNFLSSTQAVRSYLSFDFGSVSYTPTFFSSSNFDFNFGFLTSPDSTYNLRGDFRCLIY
jgi:hypothetical protein